MTSVQLSLESLEPERILTAEEAGLEARITHGPAKLLAALVRRGLQPEHLHEAASLILMWDFHAPLDEEAQREAA